jgi:uncharacterized OB-fold protein
VTILEPQPIGIPAPNPSLHAAPFWEGCLVEELRFQRCPECGTVAAKPGWLCRVCRRRSLAWEVSAGLGALYSWTVVWRPQHPSFRVPYAPAIVELDEGLRLVSSMVGCRPEDLHAGMRVAVSFHPASADIALPYFRPLDSAG